LPSRDNLNSPGASNLRANQPLQVASKNPRCGALLDLR
jgi:hypothetical protein